jgi:hypothetical protein
MSTAELLSFLTCSIAGAICVQAKALYNVHSVLTLFSGGRQFHRLVRNVGRSILTQGQNVNSIHSTINGSTFPHRIEEMATTFKLGQHTVFRLLLSDFRSQLLLPCTN